MKNKILLSILSSFFYCHLLIAQDVLIEAKSIMKEKYPFKAIFVVGPAGAGGHHRGWREEALRGR